MPQINPFKVGDVLRWNGKRENIYFTINSPQRVLPIPEGTLGVVVRAENTYDVRLFVADGIADNFDWTDDVWEKIDD